MPSGGIRAGCSWCRVTEKMKRKEREMDMNQRSEESIDDLEDSMSYSVHGSEGADALRKHALKRILEQRNATKPSVSKSLPSVVSGTNETSKPKELKTQPEKTVVSQAEVLPLHKDNLSQELSASENLLIGSAQHLHKLMRGLVREDQDTAIHLYDVERVMASVACAKQIGDLLKAAIEVKKYQRGDD